MLFHCKAVCQRVGGLVFCLLLISCAGTPQSDHLLDSVPVEFQKPVINDNITFFPQEAYQCGPAALATLFNWQGITVSPDNLKEQVYIPDRKGSLQLELLATTRRYGLLPYVLKPELEELLSEVKLGRPVLVFQNLGVSWYPKWHYAVVIGYNLQEQSLILHTGVTRSYVMSIQTFERTWLRTKRWAMIALRPGQMPSQPDQWRYITASVGLERVNKPQLVRAAYEAGLQKWPDSRELNMGMGNYFYAQKKLQQAGKYYSIVISKYPDFAPAHNNLAQVLAEQGDLIRALEHARQAVKLGGVYSKQYNTTLKEIKNLQDKSR